MDQRVKNQPRPNEGHDKEITMYYPGKILPNAVDTHAANSIEDFMLIDRLYVSSFVIDIDDSITIIDGDIAGIRFAPFTNDALAIVRGDVFGDAVFDRISDDSTLIVERDENGRGGNVVGDVVFDDSWDSLADVAGVIVGDVVMRDVRESAVEAVSATRFVAEDSHNIEFDFTGFVLDINLDEVDGAEGFVGGTGSLEVNGNDNDISGFFAREIESDGDGNSFAFDVVERFEGQGDDLVALINRLVDDVELDDGFQQTLEVQQAEPGAFISIGDDAEDARIDVHNGGVELDDQGEGTVAQLSDDDDEVTASGVDGTYQLGGGEDFLATIARFGTTIADGGEGDDTFFTAGGADSFFFGGQGFDNSEYDISEGGDHAAAGIERFGFEIAPGVFIGGRNAFERLDLVTTGGLDGLIEIPVQDNDSFRLANLDFGGVTPNDDFIF